MSSDGKCDNCTVFADNPDCLGFGIFGGLGSLFHGGVSTVKAFMPQDRSTMGVRHNTYRRKTLVAARLAR